MKLLCTACFLAPPTVLGARSGDRSEIVVCTNGAAVLGPMTVNAFSLRCDVCGDPVHLNGIHLRWYDL